MMAAATNAIAAVGFFALFVVIAVRTRADPRVWLLLVAILASVGWTGANAIYDYGLLPAPVVIAALEIARSLTWLSFLVFLLATDSAPASGWNNRRVLWGLSLALVAAAALVALLRDVLLPPGSLTPHLTLGLLVSVAGLLLTEILYRSTSPDMRWGIKFLCLFTGLIFAYDLFFYADANLYNQANPVFQQARGAVQVLSAPLLAVAAARNQVWQTRLSLSRQIVLGSTTLIASGLYLTLAAAIGFVLREFGGSRGPVIQVIFFVGAMAVLAIILFSGAYWAYAKTFVLRHFFRHKYDWRQEWLRFMQTISSGSLAAPLQERCVKAIADIVDSTGGSMWLIIGERCENVAAWTLELPELTAKEAARFAAALQDRHIAVDVEEARRGKAEVEGIAIPAAIVEAPRAWLVVPLRHRTFYGFVVLARPRAPRDLNWEDYDLLDVVGRQATSYLAEQMALDALEAAREFEIFNRRFAFVIHDVKNLVSQLSVLGANFEKFGHREDFRRDVVSTLNDAADSMKRLMERIHAFEPTKAVHTVQPLETLVQRIVDSRKNDNIRLVSSGNGADLVVNGDRDRLEAVIRHLIDNAVDAGAPGSEVLIELKRDGRFANVDIIDQGRGMHREFVRRELFKPFQSTKKQGMGIGAYQCREYARELGGNLEASSAPGEGTTMRITLPVADGL